MVTKLRITHEFCRAAALAVALAGAGGTAAAAPAVGDTYTYRLVNGYNKEARAQVRHEVSGTGSDGITIRITPDSAEAGSQHTVVVTPEGNWLRHLVESHGQKVEYRFATAYPAYVFPLDTGKTWSVWVRANVPGEARGRNVRVDGRVMGAERIRVPAGEFDTIRIRRVVYPGDVDFMLGQTTVTETDWYAPALGRPVRTERRSIWMDQALCGQFPPCEARGDWDIYELVEARPAKG